MYHPFGIFSGAPTLECHIMMALELDHSTPEAGKLAPCTGTGLLRPDRASVGLSF